ncbi:pyrroline-5-carboxylate reductase [Sedimenticola selenatireducens]|uniref:Pyrroline-5-carboxylate reductase n=1 Tax=Sedimenticola selenatireducens TaxID=191960 RepID=A0A2N6CXU4_9GAMM|nr:pyrroline-5-carboxylate reductase [Sedimenticola selenatireducens]PLX62113.1 MAG: pyrroline-5-carboxylate reductase [Sedimenticola selenatireducens]
MSSKTITFIGAGNMATSLIGGLVADGYAPKRIIASDPDSGKLADLSARFGIQSATDNSTAIQQADVVVLAVKPQVLERICDEIRQVVQQRQPLLVSIAAGIREADMQAWLGGNIALVRTMPNTPAMLQAGATVLHAGRGVSEAQRDLAESILRAVGLTRWVDNEALMDIATALSGSGPAYFFLVMEAMEAAAISNGLPADTARLLTIQTALGAARMAIESSDGPATLRQKVTSPGGTTERALSILEQGNLRTLFEDAISGACERSRELSEMLGNH